MHAQLIDRLEYDHARRELGDAFVRILGYFHEDGTRSVRAIEQAMAQRDSVALIIPAHTLKGESRQFGAHHLADMAEEIEMTARRCVEARQGPQVLAATVAGLADCFARTVTALEQASAPSGEPLQRKPTVFGRRNTGTMTLF